MGIRQHLISQGVQPRGPLGWIAAWIMVLFSDAYCGNLAELLNLQPEDEVLDVACGSGVFLEKRAAITRYVAGLDHSDVQLRWARRRLRKRIAAGTAEIVKGDSTALPWPNGRFSAVTCNCVGCFAQPLESIKEMHRVLSPGGRAAFAFDYHPDEEKARKAEESWGLPAWTEPEIRNMMKDAGFSQVVLSHNRHNLFVAALKT